VADVFCVELPDEPDAQAAVEKQLLAVLAGWRRRPGVPAYMPSSW
jgi:hypothetical protein